MSIIKPIDKINRYTVLLKVLFLVSLIGTGILIDKVFVKKIKNNNIPSVLGNTKELRDNSIDLFDETIKKTEKLGQSVLGEATNFIEQTTEKVSSSVSDIIYENSFGKIVDQINKLPKDQQERIRQQICK